MDEEIVKRVAQFLCGLSPCEYHLGRARAIYDIVLHGQKQKERLNGAVQLAVQGMHEVGSGSLCVDGDQRMDEQGSGGTV